MQYREITNAGLCYDFFWYKFDNLLVPWGITNPHGIWSMIQLFQATESDISLAFLTGVFSPSDRVFLSIVGTCQMEMLRSAYQLVLVTTFVFIIPICSSQSKYNFTDMFIYYIWWKFRRKLIFTFSPKIHNKIHQCTRNMINNNNLVWHELQSNSPFNNYVFAHQIHGSIIFFFKLITCLLSGQLKCNCIIATILKNPSNSITTNIMKYI